MRTRAFAIRNKKEILRDPINVAFGLGFPVVLLLLLSAIQANIPVDMFEISTLTPGIAVFGMSFISLFSATLIAKDRSTSFLMRLYASPMKSSQFILGYIIPIVPMAILQCMVSFVVAAFLGLEISVRILLCIVVLIPAMTLFIAIGLICGTLFTDKQVGGICGAILTNLTAWLSSTWFDVKLVGGVFESVANALPFVHAVNAGRAALSGNYRDILPELLWVIGYAVVTLVIAIVLYNKRMKGDVK